MSSLVELQISSILEWDKEGENVNVEEYPLRYVETLTLKPDDVATQKTMKDVVLLMYLLISYTLTINM